jgi:hypothetical protein
MPLRLTIYKEVILDEEYGNKEEFEELGPDTLLEMLAEDDPLHIIENECGGFINIFRKLEWVNLEDL